MKYKGGKNMANVILTSFVITVVVAIVVELFRPNITALSNFIRKKPFESFVVVGICIVIAILCKDTFP